MRTTITFDEDVAAAIAGTRQAAGTGLSATVNELIRRGLAAEGKGRSVFKQRSAAIGMTIDVSNVAEAIEQLDGPSSG